MMRQRLERIVALMLLAIPAAGGVLGWKWMRDAAFSAFGSGNFFAEVLTDWRAYTGLALFLLAIFFLGSFIFYRDAKQKRIQPKLRRKKD